MMCFNYRNELRAYNERVRAERRDALVLKTALVCFVVLLLIQAAA